MICYTLSTGILGILPLPYCSDHEMEVSDAALNPEHPHHLLYSLKLHAPGRQFDGGHFGRS